MEKKHLFSLRNLPIGKILLLFLLIYIALYCTACHPIYSAQEGLCILSERVRKTVILQ